MSSVVGFATRPVRVRELRHGRLAAGSLALAALTLVLVPRLAAAGSPMDEGGLLAYASRILQGDVPARDLHSFYGPLSTYLVAGVFELAGPSLEAERAVGLAYRLVLAAALLALVRRRGWPALVGAAVVYSLLVPSQGLAAFASYGALAASATALVLADARRPFPAGAAAGLAVLFRFDWALPLALAAVPYLAARGRRTRLRTVAGAAVVLAGYVPYLVVVGPDRLRLWGEQLRSGQAARHLPLPDWSTYAGRVLYVAAASIVVLGLLGLRRRRLDEGVSFLAAALFGAGLLPYVLTRPDQAHVLVAAVVPVTMLAAAAPAAVEELRAVRGRLGTALRVIVAVALAAAASYFAVLLFADRDYELILPLDAVSASLDASTSDVVSHAGRTFRLARDGTAPDAQRAVDRAAAIAPPGGRLFVGPADLRRTNYADAYLYYLLPELRPATFYVTLDPLSTEQPGVRLADGLKTADVLILNAAYDRPQEQNASSEPGAAAPNRVVRRDFCLRGRYGGFRVYARCGGRG